MANCGTCIKPILGEKGLIKCTGKCNQTFHLGCTPIQSEENIAKLGVRVETWECPKCASEKSEAADSFVDEVVTRSVIEDIVGELKTSSHQKMDALKMEVLDLRKSVAYLSRKVDEFKNTVEHIEEELGQMHTEHSRLQSKNGTMWRTVVRLGDDVSELQLRLREGSAARDIVAKDSVAPRVVAALGLSLLTVAGVLCVLATRVFKRALRLTSSEHNT